jgi:hypothetical protein
MGIRLSSRGRLAIVLAAVVVVAAVAALVIPRLGEDTPVGAPNPHAAVALYVDALNDADIEALRQLSLTSGPAVDAGIDRRLDEYGDRRIKLLSRDVEATPGAREASALLTGVFSDNEQPYRERLLMNRSDEDRWYVNLDEPPAT